MQEKTQHIVFQVINYLFSDASKHHKLLTIDKLILIALASHKGIKGIFPMQETLADEVGTSLRYMKTRLKFLEKNGFIYVEQIYRKNHYYLTFLSTASDLQITSPNTTGDLQITPQVIHRSPHRGSTDATINKVSNKVRTESERKPRARPLSLDFENSKEDHEIAKALGLTHGEEQAEFEKFIEYYVNNGAVRIDWHKELQNWFGKYEQYKLKKARAGKKDEPRSTVKEYEHSVDERRSDPVVVKNALKGIMAKLKGRSSDGLGSEGEGEEG